jgi:putative lysine/arginine/ornithine/histidine/octopine transport system permease protein
MSEIVPEACRLGPPKGIPPTMLLSLHGFGPQILLGMLTTIEAALGALVLGIVLGLAMAMAKLSPSGWVRRPVVGFTSLVRGIPEFVVLLTAFYGGQILINNLVDDVDLDPFVVGVLCLGVIFACYASETFRGAFLAVPKGQMEAAYAFGMSHRLALWRIRLPQLWRYAIPGLGNLWLSLIKDTALLSLLGMADLMRRASTAAQATKQPFNFYFIASLLYLALTAVSIFAIRKLQQRAQRGVRMA